MKSSNVPKRQTFPLLIGIILVLILAAGVGVYILSFQSDSDEYPTSFALEQAIESQNWIDHQLIPVDGTSRRGETLDDIKDIVIHYVGNPGTTAQNNHDYYTNADSTVSSHFIVGLDGEIIQCVPVNEKSSASNWRNNDTISIENCHPDETGKFNDATYQSLVKLTAYLLAQTGLNEEHIIRHYDITEKQCPLYFVEHEDAWEQFKQDVASYRETNF